MNARTAGAAGPKMDLNDLYRRLLEAHATDHDERECLYPTCTNAKCAPEIRQEGSR